MSSSGEVQLLPEQVDLLAQLVEASQSVEQRQAFLYVGSASRSEIVHPGFPEARAEVYYPDLDVLRAVGLLQVHHEGKMTWRFSVSPSGYAVSEKLRVADGRTGGSPRLLELMDYPALSPDVGGSPIALDASCFDPELWEHVSHLVAGQRWTQVASQTAIFVEDRIRLVSHKLEGKSGKDLMTAAFHPATGELRLGQTEPEQGGWHLLALGFAAALRNVDTHRIQDRPDLMRYALGVLGTGSLLITQVRFEKEEVPD